MNGRTLSLLIISLIAGILIGRLLFVNVLYACLSFPIAVGAFVISISLSRKHKFKNYNWLNEISAVSLFVGIGVFSYSISKPVTTTYKEGKYSFSGIVNDYSATSYGDKLLVDLTELNLIENNSSIPINSANVRAFVVLEDATNIKYGSIISGYASFQPVDCPSNYRNDDYVSYLKQKGIYLKGYTDSSNCNFIDGTSLNSFLKNLRDEIEVQIESTPLSINTKSFLISLLLGDRTYIKKEERIMFTDAGVSHIFAVSGLHVSLIGLLFLILFSPLFFGRTRIWKYILALPFIWFYVFLVGFSPATCRAGIMLTLAFIASSIERKHNDLKSLGWSIILILSFMPSALFDAGFQLSVLCVGSLILIARPLNFVDHRAHPVLYKVVSVILVSFTATFSSWMVCAFYFHRFSLMFLPLNLLAVPLIPIFISLALIYLLFYYGGLEVTFIGNLIDKAYGWFSHSASFITSLSSPFENVHPHFVTVGLWILGLIFLAWLLSWPKVNFKKIWLPGAFLITALISLFIIPVSLPDGFIIQKYSKFPQIVSYINGTENPVTIPEGDAVHAEINGKNLIVLRTVIFSETLCRQLKSADIVLLCKGCKEFPLGLESMVSPNCKIVTHPSLHWRYERKILVAAKEKNITLHSLRYDGPLHVFEN